jgi:hypothetical protein
MGQGAPPHRGQRPQPRRSHQPALQRPARDCASAPQPAHRYRLLARWLLQPPPTAPSTAELRSQQLQARYLAITPTSHSEATTPTSHYEHTPLRGYPCLYPCLYP